MKKLFLSTMTIVFIIACNRTFPQFSETPQNNLNKIKSLLFEQERYHDAIAEINKSLTISNQNSILFYLRGMAYLNLKEYEIAMNDFISSMRIDPNNPLPYNGIGNIFYIKYEDILAEKFWTQGLSLAQNPSERALFLANCSLLAINEKKYQHALKLLEEAHMLSPDGRYENLKGRVYLALNNPHKAKEIWIAALNNNKLPWAQLNFKHNTCYWLAKLYFSENNFNEALKYSELALLMSPSNTDYQRMYVQLKQKVK